MVASPADCPGVTTSPGLHDGSILPSHLVSFSGSASLLPNHAPAGISKTLIVESGPVAGKEIQDAQLSADEPHFEHLVVLLVGQTHARSCTI